MRHTHLIESQSQTPPRPLSSVRRLVALALAVAVWPAAGRVASAEAATFTSVGGATATLVTPGVGSGGLGYTAVGGGSAAAPDYGVASGRGRSVGSIAARFSELFGADLTFTRLYDVKQDPAAVSKSPALVSVNAPAGTPLLDTAWSVDARFFVGGTFDVAMFSVEDPVYLGAQSLSDPSFVRWTGFGQAGAGAGYGNQNLLVTRAGESRLLVNTSPSLVGAATSDAVSTGSVDRMIAFEVSGPSVGEATYAVFIDNGVDGTFTSLAVLFNSAVATTGQLSDPSGGPAVGVPEPANIAMAVVPLAMVLRRRR